MTKTKKFLVVAGIFAASLVSLKFINTSNTTDVTKNSVMIVNKSQNSGGTGIIYESGKDGSVILTNRHVCEVVKNGGFVKTFDGQYQVESFMESQVSDLCLVYVPSNLKQQTKLAASDPQTFDAVKVSGHPALLPTVISYGHFSDRQIISIMTGTRPCVDSDREDPMNNLYCGFFGVVPVLKSYESQLVSATIMPGSSGSGVYNAKNELSGVVFAGQGDFGYGWIVPYDQVVQFLNHESHQLLLTVVDQTLGQQAKVESQTKEMLKKCVTATETSIINVCKVLKRDMVWFK